MGQGGVAGEIVASLSAVPDNEYVMLDTTLVRITSGPRPEKVGQSQARWERPEGGLTTITYMPADAL